MVTPGNSANKAQPRTQRSTGVTRTDALTITPLPSIRTAPSTHRQQALGLGVIYGRPESSERCCGSRTPPTS